MRTIIDIKMLAKDCTFCYSTFKFWPVHAKTRRNEGTLTALTTYRPQNRASERRNVRSDITCRDRFPPSNLPS